MQESESQSQSEAALSTEKISRRHRTSDSSLRDRDLSVLWHPCSQMKDYETFEPIEIARAAGSYLYTADGRQIFDAISSWWCKSLGHCHPQITEALCKQARTMEQVILANTTNEAIVRLSERCLAVANNYSTAAWSADAEPAHLPGWFGKVFYADNGSTGVEIGMKMALQAQAQRGESQRTEFAALKNGYHGETVATLSLGDCGLYADPYRSLYFPVHMLEPVPYRNGPDDLQWQDAEEEWMRMEAQLNPLADSLVAVVYEPVLQGAGGMQLYSPDILRRLRTWADANDVYLIADEIAAGFGRCGKMLASHHALLEDKPLAHSHGGALPDIVICSKGLTSGTLPLSIAMCTNDMYDLFYDDYESGKAFMHSNTYTGNALAVAVAHACLDIYSGEDICEQATTTGKFLRTGFETIAQETGLLTNIRQCGMFVAADICGSNGEDYQGQRKGYEVFQEALKRGAWLRPLGNTMYMMPPLNATQKECSGALDILMQSLQRVLSD